MRLPQSEYFAHNNTRSLTLVCDHTTAPWTVLRFKGHVTWWSFEDKIGPADEDNRVYLIRQVRAPHPKWGLVPRGAGTSDVFVRRGTCGVAAQAGGYGTNTWTFTMHLEGNVPTRFRVTALRFSPSKFMTQVLSALPDWVDTAIQLNVAHGVYDL